MARRGRVALAPVLTLSLLTTLAACAGGERLYLFPGEDGAATGAVAVLEKSKETVADQPNTELRLSQSRAGKKQVADADIPQRHKDLLAFLPKEPVSFELYFPEGSTDLTEASRAELEKIKLELRDRPGAEVQVTGYTDTVGSGDDNDRLSERRAVEIRQVMIDEGIDPELLTTVGRGERELKKKTADNVEEPLNRRVVITIR